MALYPLYYDTTDGQVYARADGIIPASPDRGIQYNNSGVVDASGDFVWSTNKELIITGDPSTFIADTANVLVTLEEDPGYAYDNAGKYDVNFRVYPFRIVGGNQYFSATYAEGTTATSSQSNINFRSVGACDPVPGADGYRWVLLNGSFPTSPGSPPYAPFAYDYYVDTVGPTLTDDDDQVYVPYVDGVDNMPIGAPNTADNLWVKGNLRIEQLSRFQGGVSIDLTGAATSANEALHVRQNAQIDGNLAVGGGLVDPFSIISSTKVLSMPDIGTYVGLNLNLNASPAADTVSGLTGIVINIMAPNTGYVNGGLSGLVMGITDSSNSTGSLVAANISAASSGSTASPSQIVGVFMTANKSSNGPSTTCSGARIGVGVFGSGNIGNLYGGEFNFQVTANSGSTTITDARAAYFSAIKSGSNANFTNMEAAHMRLALSGSGLVSNAYIFKGELDTISGTAPTNLYGIYMPAIVGGTNNYSMYLNGGQVFINDKLTLAGRLITQSGQNVQRRIVTAAGAVTVTTADFIVEINKTTGAATTVNLPGSPSAGDIYTIKDGKRDAATNNITVTPASGNIEGAGTYVMNVNGQAITIYYSGTEWKII